MSLLEALEKRSNNCCEFCGSDNQLSARLVEPKTEEISENQVVVCQTCNDQIQDKDSADANHWRCLNESMWSEVDSVKVISFRMLKHFSSQPWADNLLGMIYLEEDVQEWAEWSEAPGMEHKDVNGVILQNGDSVTLVKDLQVKGSSMKVKQGYAVRRIRLDKNDENYLQGKVDGQDIMILTKYVKKQ
jgi:protein PhnA